MWSEARLGGRFGPALDSAEAASELDYHVKHVYRLLKQATIQAQQFNRVWMIHRQEVARIKSLQGPGGRLPKSVPEQS
jgi:hypothetical protein